MMPSPITEPNQRLTSDRAVVARARPTMAGGQQVDLAPCRRGWVMACRSGS